MKRDWYVLHVKPRTEKKVRGFLRAYGYFCHLPVYVKVSRVQRRKVRRELPLFPGYVFSKLYPAERIDMLKTNLIVKTILVERPRPMIHQLRQINRAGKVAEHKIRPTQVFRDGEYVKVVSGPFYGTEGYVKRSVNGGASIVLNVDVLGQAVEVSISPEVLETCALK